MKLARKFTLAFLLGMLAVLAIHAYLKVEHEVQIFEEDMKHDHKDLGDAMLIAAEQIWRTDGERTTLDFIRQEDRRKSSVQIHWVWLDSDPGTAYYPMLPPSQLRSLLDRGERAVKVAGDGPGYLCTYVPLSSPEGRKGAIQISESLGEERRFLRVTMIRILITTIVIIVVNGILAMALGVFIVGKPVKRLIDKARRVGVGDLSGPLELRQKDEFAELAGEINLMCDRLAKAQAKIASETAARIRAIEQLQHADRLMTVGKLASGVAHELGTPLNVVMARAKMVSTGEAQAAEVEKNCRIIIEQSEKMARIVRQLLDFARAHTLKKARIDLFQVVRQSISLLRPIAEKQGISVIFQDEGEPFLIEVDPDQLQQVLSNLVINGIQAMPEGGKLTISLERRFLRNPHHAGAPEAEFAGLQIRDEGVGIQSEHLPRLFEPFFTTKDVGEGTGLGLSVSCGIAQEHGGWIEVESQPGAGSCFTVWLPLESSSCAARS